MAVAAEKPHNGLLTLLLACLVALNAGAQEAPAPAVEAEVEAATGIAADLEPAPPIQAETERPPDEPPEVLTAQIHALQVLLAGEITEETDLRGLLGVDVRDGAASAARIDQLRGWSKAWTAERTEISGGEGDDDDSAAPPSPEDAARIIVLDLSVERARQQLAFLTLPQEEIAAALRAVEEQRRLAAERAAAEAARLAAEEAARLAEASRKLAEQEMAAARSAAEKDLATERARVEEQRSVIAAQRSAYADEKVARSEARTVRQGLVDRAAAFIEGGKLTPAQADDLFQETVDQLTVTRGELDGALRLRRSPSRYDPYEPLIAIDDVLYLTQPVPRAELLQAIATLQDERSQAVDEEVRQRRETVDSAGSQVLALNDTRLALIPYLSQDKRERVMGLGPQGVDQLQREAAHLGLMCRWYLWDRARSLGKAPAWVLDVIGRASTRWIVLELLVLLGLTLYGYRRRVQILTFFNKAVRSRTQGSPYQRTALRWLRVANAVGDEAVLLLVVWLGTGMMLRLLPAPEVALLQSVAVAFVVYRVAVASLHQFFVSLMTLTRSAVPVVTSERVMRSLHMIGRYTLGVVVFLLVSAVVLGRGYLYRLVQDFAWLGAVPIATILLRHWKDDIFDAHLTAFPSSRMSGRIQRSRDRLDGLLLAIPAVAQLAIRAVGFYVRTAAMRFERIRKALSYLFRRQLETQAEVVGRGVTDVSVLPSALTDAFAGAAPADGRLDHYPRMDLALGAVRKLQAGAPGLAMAVVGARGVGKSTWLDELKGRIDGLLVHRGTARHSLHDEADVCRMISSVLDVPETAEVGALAALINDGPPRMVLIDHGHNFVLRAVRGIEPYLALTQIIRRTSGKVLWICSFAQHTWEYLQFAAGQQDVFQSVIQLRGWPEERIEELIDRRMAASGFTASFEDIAVKDVHPLQREAELAQTRERYLRLLWDYTDGIPSLALHFWLRSLVPGEGTEVRVRLFKGPVPDQLEGLAEQSKFVLNAVVAHEELTLEEASLVLQYPEHVCLSLLEQLCARRHLQFVDGRYRVDPLWDRAAVRYLRRKHLLYK